MSSENCGYYECLNCYESVGIAESRFDSLSWAARRFGFKNIGEFLGHVQECCDRPLYNSVGGFREVETVDE